MEDSIGGNLTSASHRFAEDIINRTILRQYSDDIVRYVDAILNDEERLYRAQASYRLQPTHDDDKEINTMVSAKYGLLGALGHWREVGQIVCKNEGLRGGETKGPLCAAYVDAPDSKRYQCGTLCPAEQPNNDQSLGNTAVRIFETLRDKTARGRKLLDTPRPL